MKTVLSGIQPTGNLHLGNYLGSIRNWIELQNQPITPTIHEARCEKFEEMARRASSEEGVYQDIHDRRAAQAQRSQNSNSEAYRCIFGVMNLHAITLPQDPKQLKQNVLDATAVYLACGLDPKKSIIFSQSEVSQHAELSWVLGTLTPMGWLNRMTQFKEKSENNENLGLYSYPVLMAADILLYRADVVPVGEDQKQHLELTRDIAGAFNRRFGVDYFKLPEPMILQNVKRIMSLQDGTKKMSKSDESDLSRINLTDSTDDIVKKIKKAKTDSNAVIAFDETRPEICNLLNIFSAFSGKTPQAIAQEFESGGFGKFKGALAEVVAEGIRPIQENLNRLKQDPAYIRSVLNDGKIAAQEIAEKTKKEVFEIVGL